MSNATQEIKKISELLDKNLTIPSYQRPYKWTEKHVIQLLEDIVEHVNIKNKTYRIGNIILHNNDENNNVVDGQQRLVTLSLLLRNLDSDFSCLLLNEKYKYAISKNNIKDNFDVIGKWINAKCGDDIAKTELKNKILEKCEFVVFTVLDIEEAFQLFDSQNARGRYLEPYDLLKAFHLREMASDSEDDRTQCVERWEKSVDNNTLKPIFIDHLFRIRKWSKNEIIYDFTKDEIDEFKGISLHQKQRYPYESTIRILDGSVEKAQTFPFQITSPIINGKRFFEYIDFYIALRKKLFGDENESISPEFADFHKEYLYGYYGWWRSGDQRVRNLYENIVIEFVDRFGYVDDFKNFYEAFTNSPTSSVVRNKRCTRKLF